MCSFNVLKAAEVLQNSISLNGCYSETFYFLLLIRMNREGNLSGHLVLLWVPGHFQISTGSSPAQPLLGTQSLQASCLAPLLLELEPELEPKLSPLPARLTERWRFWGSRAALPPLSNLPLHFGPIDCPLPSLLRERERREQSLRSLAASCIVCPYVPSVPMLP